MAELDDFGLIHADRHLDNAFFTGGEVKLIDFESSGCGLPVRPGEPGLP
jgi:Ser/Thr protein kinase RdoA (MazF antagonist)